MTPTSLSLMSDTRVLVVGATGQLGRVIARKLVAAGATVRALGRNGDALARVTPGAEPAAVDLRDVQKLTEACRGVDQIVATANNNMGQGANSPTRNDLAGYQNLCAAARNTGVRRFNLRVVQGRLAGHGRRYLHGQVVHRGRHPPERRAARHAPADGVHGHLDR